MDGPGSLLGGFASGDNAPTEGVAPTQSTMKREQDSTDDFEHLDREPKREEAGESPLHRPAVLASQNFLDMERDEQTAPRAPSGADKFVDHFADKFTDSESEHGDSPLHRPSVPSAPVASVVQPIPEPLVPRESSPPPVTPPAPEPIAPAPKPVASIAPPAATVPQPAAPIQQQAGPISQPDPAVPKPAASFPTPATSVPKTAVPASHPAAHVIEAEVIFRQMGLVESLMYWRSPAASGAALGGGLALLVALACCSVVSVLAYGALLALSAAVAFRLYRSVMQAVHKTNDGHPFKALLERDISIGAERAQALAAAGTAHLNAAAHELRRLFLVEDLVDSLKFGVLLWCLTYVGACFNGITLIILGWIALFTLPKAYELNKAQVDANLELARAKINEISAKVRAAVPLGRKTESEKDK